MNNYNDYTSFLFELEEYGNANDYLSKIFEKLEKLKKIE